MSAADVRISQPERWRAVALGVVCHATFLAAIAFMIASLHEGMRLGRGPFVGWAAWIANAGLALSFPMLHSGLLTPRGGELLDRLLADRSGHLRCTTYALVASLQLLAVFALWSPAGCELGRAEGAWRIANEALFAGSWILLARAMYDAGLEIQSGWLGWSSVARGRVPRFKSFPTQGLYRFTRQPVYVAFLCTLWTSPVRTTDGLLVASIWTLYCLFGPLRKEKRLLAREPERYRAYQARVPYFFPRLPILRRRPILPDHARRAGSGGSSRCA
ncbi:isoprenylcysteine carboxylmethyltransferase family protein [Myxococcota bacterium]|nr:isoprenylcysteine carboxylmethyltransferase family protein [Myxococcota bacterium]